MTKKDKKIRYIIEEYTDEYKTLFQAIMIDTYLDEKSNGMHRRELRTTINPNLTRLFRTKYLNKTYELIKEEMEED